MRQPCELEARRARPGVYVQCEEALNWAMHVPSLALAQRCMHVARALRPALSPSIVSALLSALLQCSSHPSPVAFDFMAEVLIAVRELLEAGHPQQVRPCAVAGLPGRCPNLACPCS